MKWGVGRRIRIRQWTPVPGKSGKEQCWQQRAEKLTRSYSEKVATSSLVLCAIWGVYRLADSAIGLSPFTGRV